MIANNARLALGALIGATVVTAAFMGHRSLAADSWRRVPDESMFTFIWQLPSVPKASVYEVAPTRIGTAIAWHLDKAPMAEVSCDTAGYMTSGHFTCETGKKPYLVRSVYTNGGTGAFEVHFKGSILFVHHGSLGPAGKLINLPLIVNLPFAPTELFAWESGAI